MKKPKPPKGKPHQVNSMSDPAWTIIADFVNGSHERDGNSVALSAILAQDTNWGQYNPAHVQSSVGLVNTGSQPSKPVLVNSGDYLANGYTARFEVDLVEESGAPSSFQTNTLDLANYSQEFDAMARSVGSLSAKSRIQSPAGAVEITGLAAGSHVIDVFVGLDRTCLSVDGSPRVDLIDENTRAWDAIAFNLTRGVLKSMKFAPSSS